MVNFDNIPKKKLEKLLKLTKKIKVRRLINNQPDDFKSKHAALILDKKFEVLSYGENNCRKTPEMMTIHAEKQAFYNFNHSKYKKNKKYYLYVVKLSNKEGLLGNSACCIRCRNLILEKYNIKISKVYYSIKNGIRCCNPNKLPIHISGKDRKQCGECNILKKFCHF